MNVIPTNMILDMANEKRLTYANRSIFASLSFPTRQSPYVKVQELGRTSIIATSCCCLEIRRRGQPRGKPTYEISLGPVGGKSHREHKELARNIRPRVLIVIGVSWRRPPSVNLVDSHSKLTARCILCLLLQAGIYRGRWVYFWLQIPS